jgi:type III restriction enzyme, res subunit
MKLQFKHQQFQEEAAQCVVKAFAGQPYSNNAKYIMDMGTRANEALLEQVGFGNTLLALRRNDIAANISPLQTDQKIKTISELEGEGVQLTIEMETGTGKTYTYIKTMYELNKHYGWSKFIIVVPSIAIREGVHKSFEIMSDHFFNEYQKRIQYFIYNSKQLSKIQAFADDDKLHAMIINTQAFNTSFNEKKNQDGRSGNEAARIIFSQRDDFRSRRPIDVLAQTNPIIIIDEPQRAAGAATATAIKQFNPLFTLRYSATHREVLNMVCRLDAIDAYNQYLVKKIEVKGIHQLGSTATNSYVYLEEIVISKGNPQARLRFDIATNSSTKQVTRLVSEGFNLYEHSNQLEEYKDNFIVQSIDGRAGTVRFLNGIELQEGEAVGEITETVMRRTQIRETIKTHLERERQLFGKGIKVLSLFFIDEVAKYRTYEGDNMGKGDYAQMFEEEYANVIEELQPTFFDDKAYLDYLKKFRAEQVHNGYFSKDKKGNFIDSKDNKSEGGSNDVSAYDLIMKDKERLLSFEEPTRFIFSHSALREGWDNPNIFQICPLKNANSEISKRQEIGRGMRLCVDKHGVRQDAELLGKEGVFDTNILTVIASESYEQFSKQLQKEIAESVGDRPIKVTPQLFVGCTFTNTDGSKVTISENQALKIYDQLIKRDYIEGGMLTNSYHIAKADGTLDFGEALAPIKEGIIDTLDKVFNPDSIKPEDARKPKIANFVEERFKRKEFQELWKRINIKTFYKVDFKTSDLIEKAIEAIDKRLTVTKIRMVVEQGAMNKIESKEALLQGTAMEAVTSENLKVNESVSGNVRYDLIGKLVNATGLTRRTIVAILKGIRPDTFYQFKVNPEEFIRKVGNIINDEKAMAVVQQIVYEKTNNTYSTAIFTESTLRGKLGINAIESSKSLYDLVVVDSEGVEKNFATELEKQQEVVVYTKLPRGFYINTPMGNYNPDWAIAFKEDNVKHIYFVAETKGNDWQRSQLRSAEDVKLECALRHFEAISQSKDIVYGVVKDYKTLLDKVMRD